MAAKDFLERLSFSSEIKRVPLAVRQEARRVLRHYPTQHDLDQIENYAPHVVQERMEPLYKMIKQHELADSVGEDYAAEGMIKQHPLAANKDWTWQRNQK